MNINSRPLLLALWLAASGVAIGYASEGCKDPEQAGSVAAEASYGAALLRCVDQAMTLAESKACRARVNREWHITEAVKDGGDQ